MPQDCIAPVGSRRFPLSIWADSLSVRAEAAFSADSFRGEATFCPFWALDSHLLGQLCAFGEADFIESPRVGALQYP